jgi:hypothetical protein
MFCSGNLKGRDFLEGLGVSGRIILKMEGEEIKLQRANRICLASSTKQVPSSCGLCSEAWDTVN